MPASQAQLKANKKWKESNKEHYNETMCIITKRYYYNNRDKVLAKKRLAYHAKKLLLQHDDANDTKPDTI